MAEETQAQAQDEKKEFKRAMTIAPFSQEASIGDDTLLQFDMTKAQEAKSIGRMIMAVGKGDDAKLTYGSFSLNKAKEGGNSFISVTFNDNAEDFKELVLFKSEGDDGHNYFSGTIKTKDDVDLRLTGNLVSIKNDTAEAWLNGYTFKKDLVQAEEETDGPGPS